MTKRQQVCLELLETEFNYVRILSSILTIYKIPLEREQQMEQTRLLDDIEVREIFANLPDIAAVHEQILQELTNQINHWDETRLIGRVWSMQADTLREVYPKFVNFFEKSKETLTRCMNENPRFYAFVKACEAKPEGGRQTLCELMIRPVQRLPSVQLLLTDILKQTEKANPDHAQLVKAIDDIKGVLSHINERKRKTEAQMKLFNLSKDIENFPVDLISVQRQLLSQVEVMEVSEKLEKHRRDQHLVIYLFNDCLEIVKERTAQKQRRYKHLERYRLSHVRRVIEEEASPGLFYLVTRGTGDIREERLQFALVRPSEKAAFLRLLCKAVAGLLRVASEPGEPGEFFSNRENREKIFEMNIL